MNIRRHQLKINQKNYYIKMMNSLACIENYSSFLCFDFDMFDLLSDTVPDFDAPLFAATVFDFLTNDDGSTFGIDFPLVDVFAETVLSSEAATGPRDLDVFLAERFVFFVRRER